MDSTPIVYNIAAIRKLLLAAFTAEDLRRFCMDRPILKPAIVKFGPGHGLDDMVDEVVEYCETKCLWPELLAAVEKENPRQYELFRSQLYEGTLPSGPSAPFLVPFPRNPDFVGRDEDLARLHDMVLQGTSPVGIRPTVLVGLGGIGKTQLAVEYAHAHRADYPGGIYWVNAVNPLLLEFAALAETQGLARPEMPRDQAARVAWSYLDARPDALAVFDNVEEPSRLNEPIVPGLIPANLRCCTLFTTRQHDFPRTFQPFEVPVLPEPAALRLLLRARPEVRGNEHHPEWPWARVVCFYLGWLPLALELAAAYLESYPEVTVKDYLERLRLEGALSTVDDSEVRFEDLPTRIHEMLKRQPQDLSHRHDVAVTATLRTQWNRLNDNADKDARLVFWAAGQFPTATWIPISRLGLLTGISAEAGRGRPSSLARALARLRAISLVEELTSDRLRLHPLVQGFAAQIAPLAFRLELAARLTVVLNEVQNLETQVAQRGIDAVVEDLRTGLWLFAGGRKARPIYGKLVALERVLDREAHSLRGWDPGAQPVHFRQQLVRGARALGFVELAARAEAQLAAGNCPYLRPRWETRHKSRTLLRTITGHTDTVTAVAVTPDGRWAVSGSGDNTLRVWDLDTGQELRTLTGHTGAVQTVALTPDGRRAVSGSEDNMVRVWDLDTGQELRTLAGHAGEVSPVAVMPDGRRAVSAGDNTLRVWDLDTGQELHTLVGHTDLVTDVVLTSDGRRAVSGSFDQTLRVWDLDTGQELHTLVGHTDIVLSVAVTPDGRRAVSGSRDSTVRVWNLDTGQELYTLAGHTALVLVVAVTPDGCRAISGSSDNTLRVWDLDTGQELHTLAENTNPVSVVAFSIDEPVRALNPDTSSEVQPLAGHYVLSVAVTPDGRRAVSGLSDNSLRVWDLETGQELCTLRGHTGSMTTVVVTRDGLRAVSASGDKTIRVWDISPALDVGLDMSWELHRLAGHAGSVTALAVTPDGERAVSGSVDFMARLWNLKTGELHALAGPMAWVYSVATTPDGRRAVLGSADGSVRAWDISPMPDAGLDAGQVLRTMAGGDGMPAVLAVAVTPDGRRAVLGSWDESVERYSLETGQELPIRGKAEAVVWGERWVVSEGRDYTVKVWDLKKGHRPRALTGHTAPVRTVAVTPDGRQAVSGSDDMTVRTWDLKTGQELCMLRGHTGSVYAIAVTPDGRWAVSGSDDKLVRVWNLRTGQELRVLVGHTDTVTAVAVTPDGRWAVSGSRDCTVRLWDLGTGRETARLSDEAAVTSLAVTPDCRTILMAGDDGNVHCLEYVEPRATASIQRPAQA